MKFLRVLLFVLLLLVVIAVILGFVGPKDYDVSSKAVVEAPREFVFPYLKSLEKGNDWGPWREEDPDMKVTYEGTDGTVGFASSWDGPVTGKGTQTITAIEENQSVNTKLNFKTPFGEMESEAYMQIADADAGSEVTWGFKGQNNFVARIFAVFSNMEKSTAPMFAKGLENLATLVKEDMNKEFNGFHIAFQESPERNFMAKRSVVQLDQMQAFYAKHLPRIASAVAKAKVEMQGMPCGLYYTFDEAAGQTDMAAAIPVTSTFQGRDMEVITIPAGKVLVLDYYGSYEQLDKPHLAFDAYLDHFGLTAKPPAIEEYVTDPSTEPDPSKWLTRITYLLDK